MHHGKRLTSLICLALGTGAVFAHGGGLNAEGCHNNRKTGDYHCHRPPAVTAPTTTAAAPLNDPPKSQSSVSEPTRPPTPPCHAGPRGGTYTITASGRKNYGGC